MKKGFYIVIVLVAIGAVVWYFWTGKGVRAKMATEAMEPVVITGIGRYSPYPVPIDLGGGFKEWGVTPEGEKVISTRDPAIYQPWEWQ